MPKAWGFCFCAIREQILVTSMLHAENVAKSHIALKNNVIENDNPLHL